MIAQTSLQIVIQALSAVAVLSGVVYAALQFRSWKTSQYVANFTKLVELQLQLRRMRVDDPQLAAIDPSAAPAASPEEVRAFFYNLMQLSLFEIAWFSHEHGQLTDDYFQSWVNSMTAMAQRPSFQLMWNSNTTKIVHEEFRCYVDEIMRVAAASALEREEPHPAASAA